MSFLIIFFSITSFSLDRLEKSINNSLANSLIVDLDHDGDREKDQSTGSGIPSEIEEESYYQAFNCRFLECDLPGAPIASIPTDMYQIISSGHLNDIFVPPESIS